MLTEERISTSESERVVQRFKEVAYELSILHQDLVKDKADLAKAQDDLSKKIDHFDKATLAFKEEINNFHLMETRIRSHLELSIKRCVEDAQKGIGERLGQVAASKIEQVATHLKQAAEATTEALSRAASTETRSYWFMLGASAAVGIGIYLVLMFL